MQTLRLGGLLLALLLARGAAAQDATAQAAPDLGADLPGLMQWARTHNPELAGMQAESLAARARADGAGALPDPRLRIELMDLTKGGEQGPTLWPSRVGSTRYTLMQDLPGSGKRALRSAIAEREADAQSWRAKANWQELRARLRVLQAQRWFTAQTKVQLQGTLQLLERMEQLALQRYAQGLAPQADALRAQIERSSMQRDLLMREAEGWQADQRLNVLLGRAAEASLAPVQALPATQDWVRADWPALQARALERSGSVAAAGAKVQVAELTRDLTRKSRSPDFTLGLSPTQIQSSVREWAVMLEFNLPWRDVRQSEEREALAMLDAAQARQQAEQQQVREALSDALVMLERARRTAELNEHTLIAQAHWAVQAALAGYEQGRVELSMVLDAQRQLRMAQQDALQARLDAQLAQAELDKWLGDEP